MTRIKIAGLVAMLVVAAAATMAIRPALTDASSSVQSHTVPSRPAIEPAPSDAQSSAGELPQATASYAGFDTVDSLAGATDTIVRGNVIAERTRRLNLSEGANRTSDPTWVDCIVVDYMVQRTIKGTPVKGDIIQVAFLGGEDVPGLKAGASTILFLHTTEAGPYMPINPYQGVVKLDDGKVASTPGALVRSGTDENVLVSGLTKR